MMPFWIDGKGGGGEEERERRFFFSFSKKGFLERGGFLVRLGYIIFCDFFDRRVFAGLLLSVHSSIIHQWLYGETKRGGGGEIGAWAWAWALSILSIFPRDRTALGHTHTPFRGPIRPLLTYLHSIRPIHPGLSSPFSQTPYYPKLINEHTLPPARIYMRLFDSSTANFHVAIHS